MPSSYLILEYFEWNSPTPGSSPRHWLMSITGSGTCGSRRSATRKPPESTSPTSGSARTATALQRLQVRWICLTRNGLTLCYTKKETQPKFLSAPCKQSVMSSQISCVVVWVYLLACGQGDVISTQNSCSIVCVNVLACGQVEVSRDTNLNCL